MRSSILEVVIIVFVAKWPLCGRLLHGLYYVIYFTFHVASGPYDRIYFATLSMQKLSYHSLS